MSKTQKIDFVFFGTPEFAVTVLDELKRAKLLPKAVVAAPDRPAGRGMQVQPPPTKTWAENSNIPVLQPENLTNSDFTDQLEALNCNLFIIAAYGKIVPQTILDIPKHGTLNVHPSLLPKYRGPSPVVAQILADDPQAGVTIMLVDEKMDHGPLLAQTQVTISQKDWPPPASELEDILAHEGGKLLAYIMPRWIKGGVKPVPQDHDSAIYSSLIKKEDTLIDLQDDTRQNLLKIHAYDRAPRAHFFAEKNSEKLRVVVTEAHEENGQLVITRVIPEGKQEMPYKEFMKSLQ